MPSVGCGITGLPAHDIHTVSPQGTDRGKVRRIKGYHRKIPSSWTFVLTFHPPAWTDDPNALTGNVLSFRQDDDPEGTGCSGFSAQTVPAVRSAGGRRTPCACSPCEGSPPVLGVMSGYHCCDTDPVLCSAYDEQERVFPGTGTGMRIAWR